MKVTTFALLTSSASTIVLGAIENSIPCTETCKNCVYNGIWADAICRNCPQHTDRWPCYVKDTCRCEDNRDQLNCPYAASRTTKRTNRDCVALCEDVVDHGIMSVEKFLKECSIEYVNSKVEDKFADLSKAPCYDKYIHGHKDSSRSIADKIQIGVVAKGDIKTPQQCQEACQLMDGCARFIWRWQDDKVEKRGRCVLKSKEIVKKAESIKVDVKNPATIDSVWCDKLAVKKCAIKDKCWGSPEPRCVWQSDYHISGPAICPPAKKDE